MKYMNDFAWYFVFQKKKLNREEFEAFKKQQHDLFDRLAALERSINDLRSQPTIVSDEKNIFNKSPTDFYVISYPNFFVDRKKNHYENRDQV